MAHAIVSGRLAKEPALKTDRNGKEFVVFTIKETIPTTSLRWWQGIAFPPDAVEAIRDMHDGDPIAVAGEITAEIYAPADAESRINWRITVDGVLSARKPPKREGGAP